MRRNTQRRGRSHQPPPGPNSNLHPPAHLLLANETANQQLPPATVNNQPASKQQVPPARYHTNTTNNNNNQRGHQHNYRANPQNYNQNQKNNKNRRASMNAASNQNPNFIPKNQRRGSYASQLMTGQPTQGLAFPVQRRDNRSLSISSSLASSGSSSNSSPCSSLHQIFLSTQPQKQAHHHHHKHRSTNLSNSSSSSVSSGLSSGSNSPTGAMSPRVPPIIHTPADYDSLFRSTNELSLRQDSPDATSAFWFPESNNPCYLPAPPPRPWLRATSSNNPNVSPSSAETSREFTVLSYNVLCDRMVSNEMFPSSPNIALNWEYRRELILRQLLEFGADVIALQELELEQFETFFQPKLNQLAHYQAIFEPKSRARTMDSQKRRRVDGCAIFFKANKFKLIQRHLLEYNQIAMANAQGSEAMLNRVMTKDNIGLAAILEFVEPSGQEQQPRRILVCNTHIHWDPECCDVKLIQTIMLMNELECIAKNYKHQEELSELERDGSNLAATLAQQEQQQRQYKQTLPLGPARDSSALASHVNDLLPLVLLGDFNSLPESGVTSYLTSGRINSLHKDFKNFKYTSCSNALSCFLSRSLASIKGRDQSGSSTGSLDDEDATTSLTRHPENQLRRQSSPAWCFYSSSASTSGASSLTSSPKSKAGKLSDSTHQPVLTNPTAAGDNILSYKHPFGLRSAYQQHTMDYTNYTTNFKAIIDYIFYSQTSIRLVGLLGPLDNNWLRGNQILGLPQLHLPSDHLPLLVKLELLDGSASRQASPAPTLPPELPLLQLDTQQQQQPKQRAPFSSVHTSSSRKRIKQANIEKLMAEDEAAETTEASPASPHRPWTCDHSRVCQPAYMPKTMNLLNQLSKTS